MRPLRARSEVVHVRRAPLNNSRRPIRSVVTGRATVTQINPAEGNQSYRHHRPQSAAHLNAFRSS
jgi:hypothetical protein